MKLKILLQSALVLLVAVLLIAPVACHRERRLGTGFSVQLAPALVSRSPVICDNKYSLILRQLDFFIFGCAIEGDGVFVDTFDFPAFLGIDPGVGFGFMRATHAAYDAVA